MATKTTTATVTHERTKTTSYRDVIKDASGKPIMTLTASVDPTDPESTFKIGQPLINNQALYRENRDQVKAIQSEFEDVVYADVDALTGSEDA